MWVTNNVKFGNFKSLEISQGMSNKNPFLKRGVKMKITFLKSHSSKRFHILKNRIKLAKKKKKIQVHTKSPRNLGEPPFKHWPVILEELSFEISFIYLLIEQMCSNIYMYICSARHCSKHQEKGNTNSWVRRIG